VNMALSTAQASLKRGILLIFWMIELFVVLVVSLFVEYDTFFVYFWGLSFSFVVLRSPLKPNLHEKYDRTKDKNDVR